MCKRWWGCRTPWGAKMVSRGTGGIIHLASNSAFQPLPHMATYAAAKAFVLHFSEALEFELKGRGVRVMAVCPGPTATSFFEGVSTKMKDGLTAPRWWSAAPCDRSIRKSPSPILDGSACASPFGSLVCCPAMSWLALPRRRLRRWVWHRKRRGGCSLGLRSRQGLDLSHQVLTPLTPLVVAPRRLGQHSNTADVVPGRNLVC
jgi:NAD(P)-dependent dehydrogenase (short-subunit alcohol dehydrogenase family)